MKKIYNMPQIKVITVETDCILALSNEDSVRTLNDDFDYENVDEGQKDNSGNLWGL